MEKERKKKERKSKTVRKKKLHTRISKAAKFAVNQVAKVLIEQGSETSRQKKVTL